MSEVDYADVQGLVRFGYGHMTRASYALVKMKNVAAAKSWLRSAPLTSAVVTKPPPATALNVAFTAPGLRALGVPQAVIAGFSHEFRGGMAEESRARQLGDVGRNASSRFTTADQNGGALFTCPKKKNSGNFASTLASES